MDFSQIGELIVSTGIAATVKESINAIMQDRVKPLIKELDYSDPEETEECIRKYLQRLYEKSMIMNTIVFRGTKKTLFDLYIPLTIVNEENKYIINDNYIYCLEDYNRLLIIDTAGMGKSTIIKYLTAQVINNGQFIPVAIEARKLKSDQKIEEYILEQLGMLDKKVNTSDLISMLNQGNFIIFIDGYDEIIEAERGKILDMIQSFIEKTELNKYVITSRAENDLDCLGNFEKFSVKPLSIEEAFLLIEKYDNCGELSKKLIARIKSDNQITVLREFLTNPMLVSLLYKTFEYKEEIAYKKIGFYSQVYEALFNDHDKTKGGAYVHPKKTGLDIYDFEKVLRRVGFISLQKNVIEFSREEILKTIEKSLSRMSWMNCSAVDFLDDLTHAVPLFQKDGNSYKWTHKSFMEYFAAGFICYDSEKTGEILNKMFTSDNVQKYTNVLDFSFDMKQDVARRDVLYPYIKRFVEYCDKKYQDPYFDQFSEYVDYRKGIEFQGDFYYHNNMSGDIEVAILSLEKEVQDILNYKNKWSVGIKCNNHYEQCQFLFNKGYDLFFYTIKQTEFNVLDCSSKVHIYCDNKEAEINSVNNFQISVNILANINRLFSKKYQPLSYIKCKKTLAELEKEIEDISDFDF